MRAAQTVFPPFPTGLKGRKKELAALADIASPGRARRIALVGTGGSGKSMLACALGYRVRAAFGGGLHWFRSGPWDVRTLGEMLAIRFRTARARPHLFQSLRRFFETNPPMFVVLDNHENDRAVCAFMNELGEAPVNWIITARRCLLGGVYVFPVVAPLATTGQSAFPKVRALASRLRYNPLALDIADAIVQSGAVDVGALGSWLTEAGIERVRVIDHEDDLPEVALLLSWAWDRLSKGQRRVLAVLAHSGGDHVDGESLARLARLPKLEQEHEFRGLRAFHLVQQPFAGRYALHAVVRHAVLKRTQFDPRRMVLHYLDMLERHPNRLDFEQTHLYAAMDYAHAESNLDWMLRIEQLLAKLDAA